MIVEERPVKEGMMLGEVRKVGEERTLGEEKMDGDTGRATDSCVKSISSFACSMFSCTTAAAC